MTASGKPLLPSRPSPACLHEEALSDAAAPLFEHPAHRIALCAAAGPSCRRCTLVTCLLAWRAPRSYFCVVRCRRAILPALHKKYLAAMLDMFGDCALHGAAQLDKAAQVCSGLLRAAAKLTGLAVGVRGWCSWAGAGTSGLRGAGFRLGCTVRGGSVLLICFAHCVAPRLVFACRRGSLWRWRTSSPASA